MLYISERKNTKHCPDSYFCLLPWWWFFLENSIPTPLAYHYTYRYKPVTFNQALELNRMNGNLLHGMNYYLSGFKLMFNPRLLPYVLSPLLINITLFSCAVWYSSSMFTQWLDWLLANVPEWLAFVEWILWPMFVFTIGTLIFFSFNMVANVIAAPFNSILAEKAEQILTRHTMENTGVMALMSSIPASLVREFHKMRYYFPRLILISLLFFIPGINVLVFIFAAWMMAIQYIDYPMDNHKIAFKNMLSLLRSRNLSALGFGTLVMLSLMVPILNFIVIPAAVCGASIFWVNELKPIQS